MSARADTVLAERYRLERPVGAGGMGDVWQAEDLALHRSVAVKVVADAHRADAGATARFEREAQAAAQLVHPNLATVFDYGEDDDELFLVMELLEGQTLASRLRKGPMPADEVCRLGAELADGLAAVHRRGIVHRDVKPGNVMLTQRGAKLMDFGIAAGLGEPLTATGDVIGTAAYLAPERVRGRLAGPEADVYALGAVLHEAATGRRAFTGSSPAEVGLAHLAGPPPRLDELVDDLPAVLVQVCADALETDPQARPPASVVAARLAAADGSAPTGGAQPTMVDSIDRTATMPISPSVGPVAPTGADSPTVAPRAVPTGARRPAGTRPPAAVLVVGAAIVLVLVLAILWAWAARADDGDQGEQPASSVASSTTAPAAAAPPTTAAPASTPAPPVPPASGADAADVPGVAGQVLASIEEGEAADELEGRVADALSREVDKAVRAAERGDGDKALEHVATARDRLDEAVEQGEVTEERAAAVGENLDALAVVIGAATDGDTTDGPGGGPSGEDDDDDGEGGPGDGDGPGGDD